MEGASLFHIKEETADIGIHAAFCVYTYERTKGHTPLSPSSQPDWSPSSDHLSLFFSSSTCPPLFKTHIHSSSPPLFLSSVWKRRTWFLPLALSPSLPPHFFFICLPTQSGLILLVTVDIWGPAHSVWLSSRETFPRETLWIQLRTRTEHRTTHSCWKTRVYKNTHMHTLHKATSTIVNGWIKIGFMN